MAGRIQQKNKMTNIEFVNEMELEATEKREESLEDLPGQDDELGEKEVTEESENE